MFNFYIKFKFLVVDFYAIFLLIPIILNFFTLCLLWDLTIEKNLMYYAELTKYVPNYYNFLNIIVFFLIKSNFWEVNYSKISNSFDSLYSS